jgi:hypothetical protein
MKKLNEEIYNSSFVVSSLGVSYVPAKEPQCSFRVLNVFFLMSLSSPSHASATSALGSTSTQQ